MGLTPSSRVFPAPHFQLIHFHILAMAMATPPCNARREGFMALNVRCARVKGRCASEGKSNLGDMTRHRPPSKRIQRTPTSKSSVSNSKHRPSNHLPSLPGSSHTHPLKNPPNAPTNNTNILKYKKLHHPAPKTLITHRPPNTRVPRSDDRAPWGWCVGCSCGV
jgi:hypothetical protein